MMKLSRMHHHRGHHYHRLLVWFWKTHCRREESRIILIVRVEPTKLSGPYVDAHTTLYQLKPHHKEHIMIPVTVGHTVEVTITVVDQHGNPMQTQPAFDAPPAWTGGLGSPPVDTITVSADGTTLDADVINPGTDSITCAAVVGGQTFSASVQINASPEPQVASGIVLNAVVK